MTSFMLLSLLIFIPLVGSAIVGFGFAKSYDRSVAITAVGLQVLLLAFIVSAFQVGEGFQFQESADWIHLSLGNLGHFSSRYALGMDGLSLPLVLLTGIISFIALWNSKEIKEKTAAYYGLVLLLNASLMGCFLAQDMFLFYVFFEFMLLPMYFLIGIWGGPRRQYASLKFFIYTLVGSLFILIVMLGLSMAYIDP